METQKVLKIILITISITVCKALRNEYTTNGGTKSVAQNSIHKFTGGYTGGVIPAAIQSRRNVEVRPVNLQSDPIQPAVVLVDAGVIPLTILFRSASSALTVMQEHSKGQVAPDQHSKSEDEPHRLIHEVTKPIIQEVREIITPYRRVVQEIQPVQEDIHTIVARGEQRNLNMGVGSSGVGFGGASTTGTGLGSFGSSSFGSGFGSSGSSSAKSFDSSIPSSIGSSFGSSTSSKGSTSTGSSGSKGQQTSQVPQKNNYGDNNSQSGVKYAINSNNIGSKSNDFVSNRDQNMNLMPFPVFNSNYKQSIQMPSQRMPSSLSSNFGHSKDTNSGFDYNIQKKSSEIVTKPETNLNGLTTNSNNKSLDSQQKYNKYEENQVINESKPNSENGVKNLESFEPSDKSSDRQEVSKTSPVNSRVNNRSKRPLSNLSSPVQNLRAKSLKKKTSRN